MDWSEAQVQAHVDAFLAASLTREAWAPHESHLVATTVVCRRHSAPDALVVMRDGIRRQAAAIGVPPDAYHETITRLYVEVTSRLVAALDHGQPDHTLVRDVVERLGTSREQRSRLWAALYDHPERVLADDDARRRWVAPDRPLDPLPSWLLVGDAARNDSGPTVTSNEE